MPEIRPEIETIAKIKVVGIGGGGGSAINRMVAARIKGVDFTVINTDLQALHNNDAKSKLHIGQKTTKGLGAGMNPEIGLQAAQENINEIRDLLKGSDMVFITCGLGGGTGTGAAPVIAQIAKELGALTVAVVTKPFAFEGKRRSAIAESGLRELRDRVDTIITIPNDKIFQIIEQKTTLNDAFQTVDDILRQAIAGISEIITVPAQINVDFADVRTIMREAGSALMSIGEASGENRAVAAAKMAVSSPLLDINIDGAKGVLFIVSGGPSLTMHEVKTAADIITESVDENAKIIFGVSIDEALKDKLKITLVATGFGDFEPRHSTLEQKYTPNRLFTEKKIEDKSPEDLTVKAESTFEKSKNVLGSLFRQSAKDNDSEELEVPTFMRRGQTEAKAPELDDDDLEIPAFIRKKMK